MRNYFLSLFLILLIGGCASDYNNSPAEQPASTFSKSKQQLRKSRDSWQFSTFISELSKVPFVERGNDLQKVAKAYFPDSTIHEDHLLQGQVLNYQDSFHIVYYEYSLDQPDQNNMYIGSFSKEGDAQDILPVKEVSFDGSITINLIDAEILEVQYYDFFKPRPSQGDARLTDTDQHSRTNAKPHWHQVAVKNYNAEDEIIEFYHFENFRINAAGQFEKLNRADSINLQRRYPHASLHVLSEEELNEYTPREWRYIINEIYAAHGFIFRSEEIAQLFRRKAWYQPKHRNVDALLSDIEKLNIHKITAMEKEL